jgi:hypothetical protein
MRQRVQHRIVMVGILAVAAMAAAPGAGASVMPALTLDQSAGSTAGSLTNLGMDLKFSSSSGDSPKQLTINLPPGLLANASIDGGACLASADLNDSACQVGTGVVTADLLDMFPTPTPVTFDLVPPPAAGDLAGLAVNSNGTQVGTTGDIRIRPSGDPAGVGVTISLTLPNNLYGTPISISEINSTFDSLRYPTTCPATPQNVGVTVDSYGDQATTHSVAAPLSVSGCSALPYAPAFKVSVARDRTDREVSLSTTVTQGAIEAPNRSVSLAFPTPTLSPNIQVVGLLCANLSSGTCTPVGSVSASSPLYPSALTGQAYLTGNPLGPSLTLVFPAPFPLTLSGAVDLTKNTATFTGLPDIPLTNLTVSLSPGPQAVFETNCQPPSTTATATLTDQNGDRTLSVPAKFTISGCPGGGGGGGSAAGGKGIGTAVGPGGLKVSNASITGLSTGHPSLRFRVTVPKGAAALRGVAIVLPRGLSFARRGIGTRLSIRGVHVSGGLIASLSLSDGHLLVRLRKAVSGFTVRIDARGLSESSALKAQAKAHKLPRLVLSVITTNTAGKRITLRVRLNH